MTLKERMRELVKQHGGVRKAARALDIDHGYFSRLWDGSKNNPSDRTLRKLGLTRTVNYQRIGDGGSP